MPDLLSALYADPDTSQPISTNSMLATFGRCPRQAMYKYHDRLKPKTYQGNLQRGQWFHALLELYHNGEDWRAEHRRRSAKFDELFDEEKERWGDLPRDVRRLMRAYIWHYKDDEWEVLETEFLIEVTFPDGTIYRAKVDALIRNQFGLWLVDHKTHKTLPRHTFRLLDTQSAMYLWAALKKKYGVEGFIWNYVRWKPPTVPKLVYVGTKRERLSTRAIETDYPTFLRALKRHGLDPGQYKEQLARLKAQRYVPGEVQTSPFFQRTVLEKDRDMLRRVAKERYHTSKRMHAYDFSDRDAVERVINRSCEFTCSYSDLCTTELMGGNVDFLVRRNYRVEDPLSYYYDDDHREATGE